MLKEKLVFLRKRLNIRQEDLAEMAEISIVSISNIERGKDTKTKTLEKISKALGVPMSYWWSDQEFINLKEEQLQEERDRYVKLVDKLIQENERLEEKLIEYESKAKDKKCG